MVLFEFIFGLLAHDVSLCVGVVVVGVVGAMLYSGVVLCVAVGVVVDMLYGVVVLWFVVPVCVVVAVLVGSSAVHLVVVAFVGFV